MEFPPIIAGHTLYFTRNSGGTYAIGRRTGTVKWRKRRGPAASSPAYSDQRLFVTSLTGKIVALRARDGKIAMAETAAEPNRVVADRVQGRRLLRQRERHALRAMGADRKA